MSTNNLEITQSLLNQMAKCPYQIYLSRIKGIKIPPGIAARKGSSVHKGAEHIHREKLRGVDCPIDEATDAARDEYVHLIEDEGIFLTKEEQENQSEVIDAGLNDAVSCVRTYRKHISPGLGKIALIEERLFADIGVGFPLSGKPDLVVDEILDDIKTGKRWAVGAEHTTIQPTMYRLLLKANNLPVLGSRYTMLCNMKKGTKSTEEDNLTWDNEEQVLCDRRVTSRTDADEAKLILRCQAVAEQIKTGNFPPGSPSEWYCSPTFCGFYGSVCKYT